MKRFFKILVFILVIASSLTLVIGQPAADFSPDEFTKRDYSNVMKENISGDPLVTEIAMLAAHDVLSAGIKKDSPINYLDRDNLLSNPGLKGLTESGLLQAVAGGFAARTAVAQKSSVYDLLKRGTRYLDVRVAEYDGGFYGCHGFIADPISDFLTDTLKFLEETDGELVVIEIRHGYFDKKGYAELFEYTENVKRNGKSLLDYIRYDPTQIPLKDLRYGTATNGGSGVIILTPEATDGGAAAAFDSEREVFGGVAYTTAPYAVWHNQTKESLILERIGNEYEKLKETPGLHGDVFRINQAQRTPKFAADSIFDALTGWSLLDMAYKYNYTLLTHPDFKEWLTVMPIFQVDYADGMYGGFNDKVMEIINEYNAKFI
jgi:hypothetical protein